MSRWIRTLVGLGVLAGLCLTGGARAQTLYGVTGDGAGTPETFYTVNTSNAATTFVQTLGNGTDGESIAFRPNDGLMYHWSGFSSNPSQIMETINLTGGTVTNVGWSGYDPEEVWGSTFDAVNDRFFTTDINRNLATVTSGGLFSNIGPLANAYRGLAFHAGLFELHLLEDGDEVAG